LTLERQEEKQLPDKKTASKTALHVPKKTIREIFGHFQNRPCSPLVGGRKVNLSRSEDVEPFLILS
jgi:hypothetical protein